MKKAQKRETAPPAGEHERSQVTPFHAARAPETERREEVEREAEEIV